MHRDLGDIKIKNYSETLKCKNIKPQILSLL